MRLRLVIGLIGFFSIILIFFSVVIFLLSYAFLTPQTSRKIQSQTYQITEINPSEASVKRGLTTLPISLEQDEYVSYLNEEEGSSIVITHFGGSNYECTGSCYCNEESRRISSSGHLISRGLILLFSAFSVSMATKIAHETFHDQCVDKYSSVCLAEDIESDVENCELQNKEKEKSESDEEMVDPKLPGTFLCKGYCLDGKEIHQKLAEKNSPFANTNEEFWKKGQELYGLCESYTLEKTVTLSYDDYMLYGAQGTSNFTPELEMRMAQWKFLMEHLTTLCKESTRIPSSLLSDSSREELDKQKKELLDNLRKENSNEFTKIFGEGKQQQLKEIMENNLKAAEKRLEGGFPYCFPTRFETAEKTKTITVQGGGSLPDMDENIKCVSTLEENPKWDWDAVQGAEIN